MKELIRKTTSFCPVCLSKIEAAVIEKEKRIYLEKRCSRDGDFELLISQHPQYYRSIHNVYFSLFENSLPQKDYLVNITNRCNLNCPICLANSNKRAMLDFPKDKLAEFLIGKKGYKIGLMGAEPTLREDLPEIIEMIVKSGNIPELHTNGIKLLEQEYVKKLKDAGLKEVHLQFDGFDDEVYLKIRGKSLLDAKMKALINLKQDGFSVDLKATILRGVNEKEMAKILDFGLKNSFIKEVFFLGCRFLGRARGLEQDLFYMPDELVDIIEKQVPDLFNRNDIRRFLKLYYLMLKIFKSRKCFYNQHYIILRKKGSALPISRILNLKAIEDKIEFILAKKGKLDFRLSALRLWPYFLTPRFLAYFVKFKKLSYLLKNGFDISAIPDNFLLIGFISACDSYSYDEKISLNCGKGAVSLELGVEDSGALDNVLRDRLLNENFSAFK
ncbi:MAG: radical SAM protein [Candidatus Omnitrophica bacterium]|nr:radical SAM protein [Candidatus Omnitrophota bacterium]